MVTIETSNKNSEITEVTDIRDASKFDFSWTKKVLEQKETWWKMWKKEAMRNISKWQAKLVARNLSEYTWLDSEVGISLIKNWELETVCNKLEVFKPITIELQNLLIKKWKEVVVAKKAANISNVSSNEVANNLLKKWRFDVTIHALVEAINKWLYKNLDDNVAYAIIDDRNNTEYYMKDFAGGLFFETKKNKYRALANNLKYFQDLDLKIAEILINKWQIENVVGSIEVNKNIFTLNQEFAEMLINNWYIVKVAEHLEFFDKKWKEYIESKLIEKKYLKDINGQRKQYESLNKNEIVWKKYEIVAINQLKKMIWFDNIDFKENKLCQKSFSWKLDIYTQEKPSQMDRTDYYRYSAKLPFIPITIYHEKWDINNIRIDGLNIKVENLEDATAILKTIINVLIKVAMNSRLMNSRYTNHRWKYKKCKYSNGNVYIKRDKWNGSRYDEQVFNEKESFQFPLNDKKTMKELVNYINNKRGEFYYINHNYYINNK